jgi:ceramide glucosyltransferase
VGGGAGSEDDPAVEAVQRLIAEFPALPIRLAICPERLGTNGKVSNLIQMQQEARHEFLLINDSDIRVSPRYLERVMRQFAAPAKKPVGMVTALYRGRAARSQSGRRTLGSILEALGIATDFQAGVLAARLVEGGIHFGLGSTLAVRREALATAGGLEALVNQLADDYEMGARIAAAGYSIRLATEVVETSVPAYSFNGFLSHQLRWARTVRDSRRWGYAGLLFTHLLPLAAINVLASGASFWSIWLLGLAFFLRLGVAMQVGAGVVGDGQVLANLWLLPLRDLVGFAVWLWSFAGNTIVWRGERFVLKQGRLERVV